MGANVAPALLPEGFPDVLQSHRQECLGHSIAAALAGFAVAVQLEWFGIIYASEILLALAALWALLTNLTNGPFWRRPFTLLLACLGVTMLAYLVSDLVVCTEAANLMRGWARLIFLGSNFIGLYYLCRRNPFNVVIYVIAFAAAMLAGVLWSGGLFDDWKFGASAPVTLLVACPVPLVARRGVLIGSAVLAAVGVAHLALDSREIGGNCLLAGILL